MAPCTHCNIEDTELYENGALICIECVQRRKAKSKKDPNASVQVTLVHQLNEATLRAKSAFMEFNAIAADIPSYLAHPDGTQRLHNASQKRSLAHREMIKALTRLSDYLTRGIEPRDLSGAGEHCRLASFPPSLHRFRRALTTPRTSPHPRRRSPFIAST
jgi:hypothetical protein